MNGLLLHGKIGLIQKRAEKVGRFKEWMHYTLQTLIRIMPALSFYHQTVCLNQFTFTL